MNAVNKMAASEQARYTHTYVHHTNQQEQTPVHKVKIVEKSTAQKDWATRNGKMTSN